MKKVCKAILKIFVCLTIILLGYTALLAYPEPLFSRSATYHGITFYSESAVSSDLSDIALAVNRRLATSELYDSASKQRIFIVERHWLWLLLNGPYHRAIGRNVELTNAILIPSLDAAAQTICHFDNRCVGAVNILAHEATHTLVQRHIGVVRLWKLPWWQREGYAEYIGSDRATRSEAPETYKQAAYAWKELLEDHGLSFDEVLRT